MSMKVSRRHEVQRFEDGEVVVREGEESREMFIIRTGRVEIVKEMGGHEVRLATLERGSFFGEMSLLEGLPRSATARSLGITELVILRPGSLLVQIRRDPTFAFELLQQMSRRVRELNDRLVLTVAGAGPGNPAVPSLDVPAPPSEPAPHPDAEREVP
jgi:CRP/FNR family transcriptional regulator, cyclic AMP receptor protein